ncbi:MAG: PRC-barrel domain-containing protein [Blastococcus sp.]
MLSERDVSAAIGSTAYGTDGHRIGTVEHFFVDDRTGTPSWVAVTTGLFGTRHSIAPAGEATFADGGLRLPVTADVVKSAPRLAGEHLDPEEEAALRSHYGVGRPAALDEQAPPSAAPEPPVGAERGPATRARLVTYVVTEEVQLTVPVRREEVRVEEVPLDAPDEGPRESLLAPGAGGGGRHHREPEVGGLPDEIVLHAERPVVTVEVVPVERVRLRTELGDGAETVTDQVQREQVVVDQDGVPGS